MKVLDLFSGIGGFALGFQKAGFDIVRFCEIEDHCVRVLSKNFQGVPVSGDIKTLTAEHGEYDVLLGGFPCQDISIAGKGEGLKGDKSGLWFEYKRLIKEGRPKYAIIENVSALLGRGLEIILQDLAEIGYDATWTTYDSKYFGVPQRRRRVYIVAVRDGIPENSDPFELGIRNTAESRSEVESFAKGFRWDFEAGSGNQHAFTFFTRQRSNEFKATGLSGTLAKRDYKSYTDLVCQNGIIRRVIPEERLLLQGFPVDWFDGCRLTNQQKFSCNGMTVPVVKNIAELILSFDREVNKPKNADFYADGHYRAIIDGKVFLIHEGEVLNCYHSLGWLKASSDYCEFKSP